MSLDTYDNLKIELIEWSHREDMDDSLDTFIELAEAEMYANPTEQLKVLAGDTRISFSTSIIDRFVLLPSGYQEMRKMRIQIPEGESVEVKFRTPAQLNILSAAGLPEFFTVTSQIECNRISDQVYDGEFQFYQTFTPLSSSNASNTILTNHPNIYLFGGLWALKLKADQFQEADSYYQKFINAIVGANNKAKEGRYGPAPVMRTEGRTP